MRLRISPIFLSSFIALGGAAAAQGAAITYTSGYEADVLPTATAGTTADPKWGTYFISYMTASVDNGVLTGTTTADEHATYWELGTGGTPADAWSAVPATGSTVDFRVKVGAGESPFDVTIGDGAAYVLLYMEDGEISLYGATGQTVHYTPTVDNPTTEWQTYRIAFKDSKATLYAGYSDQPLISDVTGRASTSNYLLVGKTTKAHGGTFDLDYIRWTNATAEFSAPPAPEPGLLGLVSMGGILLLRRRSEPSSERNLR